MPPWTKGQFINAFFKRGALCVIMLAVASSLYRSATSRMVGVGDNVVDQRQWTSRLAFKVAVGCGEHFAAHTNLSTSCFLMSLDKEQSILIEDSPEACNVLKRPPSPTLFCGSLYFSSKPLLQK